MSTRRQFLLLQGPMGSFFKKLAAHLRRNGHGTLRVNFNGGDALHFCSSHAVNFFGRLEEWPAEVVRLATVHGITDLILYGDCRPLHQLAIAALQPLGVRVHVYEEGYFRPDWVTMEEGGVNGFSPLPRDAGFYRALPPGESPARAPMPFGSSFPRLVRHTMSYYMASALLGIHYRHYRTHRPRTYQREGWAWFLRLTENYVMKSLILRRQAKALTAPNPYYLVLLQLMGDSQITHHSPYHDMYEFLNEVLNDFAQHAPEDMRLIVKNHPLDNGLMRYTSFLEQKAISLGLSDRLLFLDGGHLPTLLHHARGVVAVNSTAGLSALHHHVPVRLMGDAVYAIPGLVSAQPLKEFWHQPEQPDAALFTAFRKYVLDNSQLYGSFYTRLGIRATVRASLSRLLEPAA